jgi:hypothetical protein
MMIAIPLEGWKVFLQLSHSEMIMFLKRLAANAKLLKYKKHPRGPKKPLPKRVSDPKTPHVSTARLIAERKK